MIYHRSLRFSVLVCYLYRAAPSRGGVLLFRDNSHNPFIESEIQGYEIQARRRSVSSSRDITRKHLTEEVFKCPLLIALVLDMF